MDEYKIYDLVDDLEEDDVVYCRGCGRIFTVEGDTNIMGKDICCEGRNILWVLNDWYPLQWEEDIIEGKSDYLGD